MFSDQVSTALISTVGGIVITYLTVKYKDRVVKKRSSGKPHLDRMDNIFDGYERLIVQLTTDMDRKESSIQRMEVIIDDLESELGKTKELLNQTKLELHETQVHKNELAEQLKAMRTEYKDRSDAADLKKSV